MSNALIILSGFYTNSIIDIIVTVDRECSRLSAEALERTLILLLVVGPPVSHNAPPPCSVSTSNLTAIAIAELIMAAVEVALSGSCVV